MNQEQPWDLEFDDRRRPRKRSVTLLVTALAASGICVLLCCGGLVYFGLGVSAEEVRQQLEADPAFVRHVGQVQEFKYNIMGSVNADDDIHVYDVKGSKWSGRVTVKEGNGWDDDTQIIWARFTLPTGEVVEIKPGESEADSTDPPIPPKPVRGLK